MKRHALSEVALMSGPGEDEDAVFRRGLPAVDLESSSNPGVKQPCAQPESHELPGGISDTSAGRRHPVRC